MASCIAVVTDLIFATRITATAEKVGARCLVITAPSPLQDALEAHEPDLILVDMNSEGISAEESIRTVKTRRPNARVVAFFSHVHTELMEKARAAGADDVWPRSAFVQRLPELLEALVRASRQ